MTPAIQEFIKSLPKVTGESVTLPHDGRFCEAACGQLKDLGYTPVDIRFIDGPEAVRMTVRGVRLGTVRFDDEKASALRLEAEIYGMKGPRAHLVKQTETLKPDTKTLLTNWGSDSREKSELDTVAKRAHGQRGPDKTKRVAHNGGLKPGAFGRKSKAQIAKQKFTEKVNEHLRKIQSIDSPE